MASYDVAVVGAGPAGTATAIAVGGAASVVLVDRNAAPARKIGECLPVASRPLLSDLGVLDAVEAGGHLVSAGVISCWGGDGLAVRDAFAEPGAGGWLLDRPTFERDLRNAAVKAGATLMLGTPIVAARRSVGHEALWELTPRIGPAIHARFLVDATGRTARIARVARKTDAAVGHRLICRFVYLPPAARRARFEAFLLVEAVGDGWWYSAPLPDGHRIVAFHTDADLAAASKARTAAGLFGLLSNTRYVRALLESHAWPPEVRIQGSSARTHKLVPFADSDWASVGDAAISFDPISSQGLTNALYSGLMLGRALGGSRLTSDLAHYQEQMAQVGTRYLERLQMYYGLERRFAHLRFWRRRHGSVPPDASDIGPTPLGG